MQTKNNSRKKLIPIFSAFEADMDSLSPFGKTGNLNQMRGVNFFLNIEFKMVFAAPKAFITLPQLIYNNHVK